MANSSAEQRAQDLHLGRALEVTGAAGPHRLLAASARTIQMSPMSTRATGSGARVRAVVRTPAAALGDECGSSGALPRPGRCPTLWWGFQNGRRELIGRRRC
jgi:hypothetical protein